jgi:sugar/nucleoside kinase (ribokinase family)
VQLVTIGDALLDVIVRLEEPLSTGADANATTTTGAGGQAANVAAWAVALGAGARVVAKRGSDAAGEVVGAELQTRGVDVQGPAHGRTGVVVSVVGNDGERTMASDRGGAPQLRPSDLDPGWFACDCLHISGYALLAMPIADAVRRAAEHARAHDASLSVDLSAWTRIRAFGAARFAESVSALEPQLVFGNEEELNEVGVDALDARTIVVKRGPLGIRVVGENARELPAREAAVVDATGAGDALAAGYLVGRPELALEAAARCVGKLGAMP